MDVGIIQKKLAEFEREFEESATGMPEKLTIASLDVPSKVGAIYSALCHYVDRPHEHKIEARIMDHESWKNDIIDELESAEEKYRQYMQSNDPVMLDMSRDELRHASYYLNHAKMSTDAKLREKLPEYQATFDRLEKMISEPHGTEKVPVLV